MDKIIGTIVKGHIDRPLGSAHPDYSDEDVLSAIEFQERYFEGELLR